MSHTALTISALPVPSPAAIQPVPVAVLLQVPMTDDHLIIPLHASACSFATIGLDKRFRLWKLSLSPKPALEQLYSCVYPKKLTYGTSCVLDHREYCFIADKYGDVYMIDVGRAIESKAFKEMEDKMVRQDYVGATPADKIGKFIMGHQEVISHVLLSPSNDFFVTIDKASKVKVSRVPNFFEVFGIHFGHLGEIRFATMLDRFTLFTLDVKNAWFVWDISKDDSAVLDQGKIELPDAVISSVLALDKKRLVLAYIATEEGKIGGVMVYDVSAKAGKKVADLPAGLSPEEVLSGAGVVLKAKGGEVSILPINA